ncbi:MAG TPA: HAD family hydrolase [Acidimicrobiia bacterium]|nr:HAD family hydrolase [Acidimicrobiia bacterium]
MAAFDFDGTLTRSDSLLPFLRRVAGTRRVVRALLPEVAGLVRLVRGRLDRDAVKARVIARTLTGISHDEISRAGTAYGHALAERSIRPVLRERIEWHRARGHEVVIVSASLASYLVTVGRALGVDAVVCTELEVGGDGRLTGRLLGGNCRGAEKVARLRRHLDGDDVELWAYGDSRGDDELLAHADHPTRVGRRDRTVTFSD